MAAGLKANRLRASRPQIPCEVGVRVTKWPLRRTPHSSIGFVLGVEVGLWAVLVEVLWVLVVQV